MNLDQLIITSYCSGDSALNPVEHLWTLQNLCTHQCVPRSTFPDEDEDITLCQQRTPKEEKTTKEHNIMCRLGSLSRHHRIRDEPSKWKEMELLFKSFSGEMLPQPAKS